jgi:hypothetical protein
MVKQWLLWTMILPGLSMIGKQENFPESRIAGIFALYVATQRKSNKSIDFVS